MYESIDLGLASSLRGFSEKNSSSPLVSLLEGSHPTFHVDPLYAGRVAVAHAFGVHMIDVRKWMRILFGAMQDEVTMRVGEKSKNAGCSEVTHILDTFSIQQKSVLASKCDVEYELTVFVAPGPRLLWLVSA